MTRRTATSDDAVMRGPQGVRAALSTLVGTVLAILGCASAVAADTTPSPSATSTSSASPPVLAPSPGSSGPSAAEVARARAAAAGAAAEVASLTTRLDAAERRLEELQVQVAQAVTADEEAQQRLADAEAAARAAAIDLATARATHRSADDAVAGEAAQMYMGGGSLQDLTTLLLARPTAMSDLALVLEERAGRARNALDVAAAAEAEATLRRDRLRVARSDREVAARAAREARDTVEAAAASASTEAAVLSQELEQLSARLDVLEEGAESLAVQRDAAAGPAGGDLLGIQGTDALGAGPRDAQRIALAEMAGFGWDQDAEFTCLLTLWQNESGWSWSATNPSSGAYGIPQALPGWKMASAGEDWLTNPATQIAWGMGYIRTVYGSPCEALAAFDSRSPHWY